MAHYAFLDNTGLVVEVITGVDEDQVVNGITGSEGWEQFYATMRPGLTCQAHVVTTGNIRKNYAGIGYLYDEHRDAFIPPQPYPSWLLERRHMPMATTRPLPRRQRHVHMGRGHTNMGGGRAVIRTVRTVALAVTAVSIGAIGVSMVFVAWLANNVRPKH
jgi:hypothetical protein